MQDTLLVINTIALVVIAVSLVVRMIVGFRTYRAAKESMERIQELAPQAKTLMESAEKTLAESRQQIADAHAKFIEMISKAREVLDLSKTQLVRIDGVLVDATERARAQIERVDLIMDDTVSRVHQTFNTLHSGVMRPIREVQGIAAGLQAMFATLFGGSRPTVAEATHDEEMFI